MHDTDLARSRTRTSERPPWCDYEPGEPLTYDDRSDTLEPFDPGDAEGDPVDDKNER